MAHAAYEWCRDNHASVSDLANIVTALFSLGLVVNRPALTDAEREAIREACDEGRWYPNDYHHIHTLCGLLKRLG